MGVLTDVPRDRGGYSFLSRLCLVLVGAGVGGPSKRRHPPCSDTHRSVLRLVFIGEMFRADATRLVRLADVWQHSGRLAPPEEPQTTMISTPRQLPRIPYEPLSGDRVMSPDLVHAFVVSERLEPVWRGVVEMPSRDVLAMMVAGSGRGVWHSPPPRCPQQRRE